MSTWVIALLLALSLALFTSSSKGEILAKPNEILAKPNEVTGPLVRIIGKEPGKHKYFAFTDDFVFLYLNIGNSFGFTEGEIECERLAVRTLNRTTGEVRIPWTTIGLPFDHKVEVAGGLEEARSTAAQRSGSYKPFFPPQQYLCPVRS